jgi:hypothetical protein
VSAGLLVAISLSDAAAATLIAAAVSALISLITLWIGGLRQVRERRRKAYAEALAACVAYREFPYAIRRRRADAPSEERVRLSETLREVQRELAFNAAWLELEGSAETARAFRELVAETRKVAGGYMHKAWNAPPARADAEMNIARIDYGTIPPLERAYLDEVRQDLAWWRFLQR